MSFQAERDIAWSIKAFFPNRDYFYGDQQYDEAYAQMLRDFHSLFPNMVDLKWNLMQEGYTGYGSSLENLAIFVNSDLIGVPAHIAAMDAMVTASCYTSFKPDARQKFVEMAYSNCLQPHLTKRNFDRKLLRHENLVNPANIYLDFWNKYRLIPKELIKLKNDGKPEPRDSAPSIALLLDQIEHQGDESISFAELRAESKTIVEEMPQVTTLN